jgi:hypothetical protein
MAIYYAQPEVVKAMVEIPGTSNSDILSYQKELLQLRSRATQNIIGNFVSQQDPEVLTAPDYARKLYDSIEDKTSDRCKNAYIIANYLAEIQQQVTSGLKP